MHQPATKPVPPVTRTVDVEGGGNGFIVWVVFFLGPDSRLEESNDECAPVRFFCAIVRK